MLTDRLERRRQTRAWRKNAKRSPYAADVAPGVAPLPGSSGVRARELFAQACETGEGHAYAGLSVADIAKMERQRHPIPNRARARQHGIRGGYTRRLAERLAMAAEIRRMDSIDASPSRKAAYEAMRARAGDRFARRTLRHLAFRQREQAALAARAERDAA